MCMVNLYFNRTNCNIISILLMFNDNWYILLIIETEGRYAKYKSIEIEETILKLPSSLFLFQWQFLRQQIGYWHY